MGVDEIRTLQGARQCWGERVSRMAPQVGGGAQNAHGQAAGRSAARRA
jgi:hypothetical protein